MSNLLASIHVLFQSSLFLPSKLHEKVFRAFPHEFLYFIIQNKLLVIRQALDSASYTWYNTKRTLVVETCTYMRITSYDFKHQSQNYFMGSPSIPNVYHRLAMLIRISSELSYNSPVLSISGFRALISSFPFTYRNNIRNN